jgi:flagellar hook-associated protein 2
MSTPPLNITGLASGLDTNSIIAQLMAIESRPRQQLATQQTLDQQLASLLQGFQTQLQSLSSTVDALRSPSLFAQSQTVASSDPTKVTASTASGAGVGGYQVGVSQLANAAQRTFSFTSPSADDTVTIDGHAYALTAGGAIGDLVTAINSDANATVYAAATDSGTLVLSDRQTGNTGTSFIQVSDTTGSLVEQTALAKQGQDAQFTVDGVAGSSSSNTVTNAIAGVTLTLKALTTSGAGGGGGTVTVTVGAPALNADSVKSALQSFVDAYNSTVDAVRAKLSEKTVPNASTLSDKAQGLLFGDEQLTDLLSRMREAIYTPIAGLPSGMSSLADLGISTGSSDGTVSQDALAGKLTLDATKLDAAIASNPGGVHDLLMGTSGVTGWAQGFQAIVDGAAAPGGTLDARIAGENAEIADLTSSMSDWDQRLALRQQALQQQFAALESALSQSQSQGQWLSGQLASLG